ncbi:MAG TPA: hypothetical protein VFQ61_25695 [Polyangiaceae bacterium]|nr:hypothetical protein [Polyangiaceae bacterium]
MNRVASPLPLSHPPDELRGLKLSFRPNLELIASTRRLVEDLLDVELTDPDARSRIVVAIHELIENTYKYSSDGAATLDVSFARSNAGGTRVCILASNRTLPGRAKELQERISSLGRLSDPMSAYVRWMTESAQREGSGLGLLRIRAECEMQLSAALDGDRITIEATALVS